MIDFLKKVAWQFEESQRRTGRTTRLVYEARTVDAIIVCHNQDCATRLRKDYGANVITLDQYLNPEYHRGRYKVKYLFDSPAEVQIILKKLDEAEKLLSGTVLDYD